MQKKDPLSILPDRLEDRILTCETTEYLLKFGLDSKNYDYAGIQAEVNWHQQHDIDYEIPTGISEDAPNLVDPMPPRNLLRDAMVDEMKRIGAIAVTKAIPSDSYCAFYAPGCIITAYHGILYGTAILPKPVKTK